MAARKCRACKTKLELYYKDKKSRIFLCSTCRLLLIRRERGYLPIKQLPLLKEKKELPAEKIVKPLEKGLSGFLGRLPFFKR